MSGLPARRTGPRSFGRFLRRRRSGWRRRRGALLFFHLLELIEQVAGLRRRGLVGRRTGRSRRRCVDDRARRQAPAGDDRHDQGSGEKQRRQDRRGARQRVGLPRPVMKPPPPPMPSAPPSERCSKTTPTRAITTKRWITIRTVCMVEPWKFRRRARRARPLIWAARSMAQGARPRRRMRRTAATPVFRPD